MHDCAHCFCVIQSVCVFCYVTPRRVSRQSAAVDASFILNALLKPCHTGQPTGEKELAQGQFKLVIQCSITHMTMRL